MESDPRHKTGAGEEQWELVVRWGWGVDLFPKHPVKILGRGGQTLECLGTLDFLRETWGALKGVDLKAAGPELFQGGGWIRWRGSGGRGQGETVAVTQARDNRNI